ncbi:response regulator [Chitinophaga sp. Mgbs1]|uniref:Response regulator n=1 Tax=Chitinophaga solisilvae TaxID=1233460 RepID=A0A433WIR9_9BACT|nr:response regulator [Chitinophaga solisilvae]
MTFITGIAFDGNLDKIKPLLTLYFIFMYSDVQILIVDDDPEDVFIMQMMCKELSFLENVHFVSDGLTLLHYLDGLYENQLPLLIILDQNMPRFNGVQTLEAIRSNTRYHLLRVIIYTDLPDALQSNRLKELGVEAFVTKPNTYEQGLEIMQQFHDCSKGGYTFPMAATG